MINNQAQIGVYHLKTKELKKFPSSGEQGSVNYIVTTRDPNQVLMEWLFFNISTGVYEGTIPDSEVLAYNARPDIDRVMYYGNGRVTVTMKALSTGATIWQRPRWNREFRLNWSPSGALLASDWLEQRIIIVDAKTGQTKALISPPFEGNPADWPKIDNLAFNPSETLLLATYTDRSLRFFDLGTRAELPSPLELQDMKPSTDYEPKFTPDGRRLMVSTLEGLEFWGVAGKSIFAR